MKLEVLDIYFTVVTESNPMNGEDDCPSLPPFCQPLYS